MAEDFLNEKYQQEEAVEAPEQTSTERNAEQLMPRGTSSA